ncbi:MAG: hypothetical protein H6659_10640 [Ardenticatenaceae bacterium]|mgnify:CR=1 FL=1|nr:hypothetical protein [Ardenticatenaceae bacterium]
MNPLAEEWWAEKVRETAVSFPFPPTPNIAAGVQARLAQPARQPHRRLAWAAALALLLAGLLSVPQVRAAIADIFRVGAITIFVRPEPTPAPAATLPPLTDSILHSMSPITLADAQAALHTPLRLPTYPPGLGLPDDVYLFPGDNWPDTAVFLWRDPAHPEAVAYTLYQIEAAEFANKMTEKVAETAVNGQPAFWVQGPHFFQLADGRFSSWLFVEGNVLVWWAGDVTYRLEGAPSLEEAVRMAESLQPLK